jgi:predicted nucleotidyltransferase
VKLTAVAFRATIVAIMATSEKQMTLSSVLFADYRRRVLGLLLLHPEQRYYLRELARLTGTVPGTLKRELTKLADAGVLHVTKVGNQSHYEANRNCPIFEELASILRKTSGLVDVLAEGLMPLAGQIEAAFVFGSMASGKASAGSDIDLMVIGAIDYGAVVQRLHTLQATLGREINPKLYASAEWQKLVAGNSAFVRDVLGKPKLFVIGNELNLSASGVKA